MHLMNIHRLLQEGLQKFDNLEFEEARKVFEQTAKMESKNPVPQFFLGMTLLALNDFSNGELSIERGLSLSPKNQLGQNLKALLLFKKNQCQAALDLLSKFPVIETPRVQALFLVEFEKILT